MTRPSAPYLRGQRIDPRAITGQESVAEHCWQMALMARMAEQRETAKQMTYYRR